MTIVFFVFLSVRNNITTDKNNKTSNTSLASTIPIVFYLLLVSLFQYVTKGFLLVGLIGSVIVMVFIHLKSERSFTRISELKDRFFLLSLLLPIIFSMTFWYFFIDAPAILKDNFEFSSNKIMLAIVLLSLPLTIGKFFSGKKSVIVDNKYYFMVLSSGLISFGYQVCHPNIYSYIIICITLFLMGIGASQLNPLMARIVMDRVSPSNSGLAASITSTLRQAGFSLGVAYYTIMTNDRVYFSQGKSLIYASILPIMAFFICLAIKNRLRKTKI